MANDFVCQMPLTKRMFENGSFSFLMVQIGICVFLMGTINFFLRQLDQIKYVSSVFVRVPYSLIKMVWIYATPIVFGNVFCMFQAGIVLGPLVLGSTKTFQDHFRDSGGMGLMEIISLIGLVFFTFLVGVKTDMDMITKASRSTIIIGFCTFLIPLLINSFVSAMIRKTVKLGQNMNDSLAFVQLTISCSSFYDTACAVADLNLLNSEIGRLGLAISIITGLCSWLYVFSRNLCIEATLMKSNMLLLSWISKIFMMIVILFIIRPVMSWMNRSTPEGKTLKEGYVSSILISVMGISVFSQSIGIDPTLGPLMIGLTVPVGSPIAEAVQKKLECFVTFVLLPPVYIIAGYHVQAFEVIWKNFVVLEIMMLLAYSAKIIVVILASLYFRMPIVDSFCLGLLLNCNGIFYLLYLIAMVEAELMSPQTYTIMIFTNLLLSMVITPMVKYLYDPSRKYAGYKRQTILNSAVNSELRILACVYNQENVPSILNFLETTNPITKDSCVCIYVLRLVELVGRATSVLIEHKEEKKNQYTQARSRNSSEKIINAFHRFEQQNEGYTIGQCYTAISPISSMDNDVSQIAMKKRTNLVIIPFGEFDEHPYRAVNRNVLQKSPCSVGILFDHKNGSGAVIDVSMSCHNIAMIFIGGADDREALAYSMRMADKPNLQLSVFRLTHIKPNKKTKKDDELICHLWDKIMHTENIVYKEEEVTDCADTASRIKCLEDSYDFIIVGRRHDSNSPILHGLDEWCVFKELGVIGDLFATSTFEGNFSVLVMQQ